MENAIFIFEQWPYWPTFSTPEFRYHQKVKDGVSSFNRLKDVQDAGWSMVPSDKALVFVDNHDTQRQMGTLNYKACMGQGTMG